MEAFDNYLLYRNHAQEYKDWKAERNLAEAKRKKYFEKNPLSEKDKLEAQRRGQVIMNAIGVMDDYSQRNATDVEFVADAAVKGALNLVYSAGMMLGLLSMALFLKGKNKEINSQTFSVVPAVLGILVSVAASVPLIALSAKAQIGASRMGRYDAMSKELNNPNHFAVLTPEQKKEVEEKAKDIKLPEEKIKLTQEKDLSLNPFDFTRTLKKLLDQQKIYDEQIKQFRSKLESQNPAVLKYLSGEEKLKADKDRQLLLNVVEKIDIASQDYAENTEMAINLLKIGGVFAGLGLGAAADKIMNKIKIFNKNIGKSIGLRSAGVLGILMIPVSILGFYTMQIQKEASRIGRYIVKKEMSENPENFAYVDDNKIKDIQADIVKDNKSFFTKIKEIFINYKDYKEYKKKIAPEEAKFNEAIDLIKLNPSQIQNAKTLQKNTFKVFNKVDEKSQKFSESTEALGQIVQNSIGSFSSLAGVLLGTSYMARFGEKLLKSKMQFSMLPALKAIGIMFSGLMLPALMEIFITKEQKQASRVADMLAIKELDKTHEFAPGILQ